MNTNVEPDINVSSTKKSFQFLEKYCGYIPDIRTEIKWIM